MDYDEIGPWSEVKLDIVREYAAAYTHILAKHGTLRYVYIDAFAGAGLHIAKERGELVPGSPRNALDVRPPFEEYYFIDLDGRKVEALREIAATRGDVHIYEGDCNHILLEEVFPNVRYEQFRRGLCLLDPYGLHLKWQVLETAGKMGSIDVFLNFPIMDINRNVLRRDPTNVEVDQTARMNAFWGDESWRDIAYSTAYNLFGEEEKQSNAVVVKAFRQRLMDVAGFARVPEPIPMRNRNGATIYYLFFASQKQVGEKIARFIFDKYRDRGAR